MFRVRVRAPGGDEGIFHVQPSARVRDLVHPVARWLRKCDGSVRLLYNLTRFNYDDTFEGVDFQDGDEIDVFIEQVGGKPVIYLLSPTPTSATVALALSRQWEFSALYPAVPIERKQGQDSVAWTVDVRPDGTLHDLRTGSDVAYLYWEATTCQARPLSPPPDHAANPGSSSSLAGEVFQPAAPDIRPSNSVLLAVEDAAKYLDTALLGMALHTEARTSFITYWLPAILRHKFIALRFLPQAAYEGAAPMDVTPVPDVMTRVFMLFRGIPKEDVDIWTSSSIERDPAIWRDVVGVDTARATDEGLFRVLEWGGMEVN
ncbi:hypothetical protein EXIGLDRAFT_627164 [Exidia glandulosa HHB12029]|uniref:Ubiquitin-like domain-containing protein n=1 Tax=Exidia glandulosa HHB12029 TaxID=1314781 RepID=A0A165CFG0_EXIGL|nr:hypothetical protein EXIGLDRAFT_627164 [Exidia glandulosa HHB12029]